LVDLYIKELDIVVEFNGDFWHANPKMFKESDSPFPFNKTVTAKEIWKRDFDRLKFLKTKVKKVIIIWEKDLKEKGLTRIVNDLIKQIKKYE